MTKDSYWEALAELRQDEEFLRHLRRMAWGRAGCWCEQDLEDAVQECFLAAMAIWAKFGEFGEDRGHLIGWMLAVSENRCWTLRKIWGRMRRRAALIAELTPEPTRQTMEFNLECSRVAEASALLPAYLREAVELSYFRGVDQGSAAAALGIGRMTFQRRLHQAEGELRDLFRP